MHVCLCDGYRSWSLGLLWPLSAPFLLQDASLAHGQKVHVSLAFYRPQQYEAKIIYLSKEVEEIMCSWTCLCDKVCVRAHACVNVYWEKEGGVRACVCVHDRAHFNDAVYLIALSNVPHVSNFSFTQQCDFLTQIQNFPIWNRFFSRYEVLKRVQTYSL